MRRRRLNVTLPRPRLDNELNSEPERIRNLYQVKARRIEPIGLVYLWPVTG